MVAWLRICPEAPADREPRAQDRVRGEVAVADVGADAQHAAVLAPGLLDRVEGQPADVDEELRGRDPELEVVDEVAAPGEEPRSRVAGQQLDGLLRALGASVVQRPHPWAASRTAARMPG